MTGAMLSAAAYQVLDGNTLVVVENGLESQKPKTRVQDRLLCLNKSNKDHSVQHFSDHLARTKGHKAIETPHIDN